ncbi:MAG: DUF2384 domain-containing protein [Pseudomonadales bacterium]|jgi:putative toxin-antitoxin system antitoxin component (TIGR02293 family)|nr:DUF2384 domain-containing protein [Pseudomonadales bacterium]
MTSAAIITSTHSAETLLGGRTALGGKPRTLLDWVSLIRHGIAASALASLAAALQITQTELAAALGIPERTLARRRREGSLNSEESAKALRLARVISRAEEVFSGIDAARDWLKTPNTALLRMTPLSLLDTDIGAESVMDTLGRIEHGVFA